MKRMGKILSLFLTAAMAASCWRAAITAMKIRIFRGLQAVFSTDYDIYIYNSKGKTRNSSRPCARPIPRNRRENQEVFPSAQPGPHGDLRAEMASKIHRRFFSIQGIKELPEWQESGRALDLSQAADPDFKKACRGDSENPMPSTDGTTNYGVPYNLEGYGYLVDKQMITDIFGEENTEAF